MRVSTEETIQAVERMEPKNPNHGATVRDVAEELRLDQSATRRRLYAALADGFIENLETRRGRPAQYRTTGQGRDRDSGVLRTVDRLQSRVVLPAGRIPPRHAHGARCCLCQVG
jgi:predicted ArsR family transcriptional regulator